MGQQISIRDPGRDRLQVEPTPHRERRDERLARLLRARIYAGDPAPGEALESAPSLAAQMGDVSQTVVQRAFDELRREGLVRGEHGRGTYVCERHMWHAEVTVPAPGTIAERAASRQAAAAEKADPAVTAMTVTITSDRWKWAMTVEAADAGPAASIAVAAARRAGAASAWRFAVSVEPLS